MRTMVYGRRRGSKRRIDVTEVPADEMRTYAADDGEAFHLERRGGRTYLVVN